MPDFTTLESLLSAVQNSAQQIRKKKFLLVSTHAQQTTGYSKVSYNLVQQIAKCADIDLMHFGFQRFFDIGSDYRLYPPHVQVYDPAKQEAAGAPKEQGFGYSQLPAIVKSFQPDYIMIYNDAAVITSFLDKLQEAFPSQRSYKMIIYFDQVYITQRPDLLARIDKDADLYFAFTQFWKDCLYTQGIRKPIHILRHGFDADLYKPMDRSALRKKHGLPENLFLMVNINRNTPRKRYDILVTALAELVARYPTKPIGLLCVCDGGELGGFPMHEIYVRELIKRNVPVEHHMNKLMITKTAMNYTDETVNELYCMADIGVSAAEGEGFGLCNFEAMGCGVPQVVPDVGGFKDFCRPDNTQLVKPERSYYIPYAYSSLGGIAEVVAPSDLCLAIEEYLLDSELREKHGKAARETVLKYRWEDEVRSLVNVLRST